MNNDDIKKWMRLVESNFTGGENPYPNLIPYELDRVAEQVLQARESGEYYGEMGIDDAIDLAFSKYVHNDDDAAVFRQNEAKLRELFARHGLKESNKNTLSEGPDSHYERLGRLLGEAIRDQAESDQLEDLLNERGWYPSSPEFDKLHPSLGLVIDALIEAADIRPGLASADDIDDIDNFDYVGSRHHY
jgi:hypothetical protein